MELTIWKYNKRKSKEENIFFVTANIYFSVTNWISVNNFIIKLYNKNILCAFNRHWRLKSEMNLFRE